MRNRFRISLMPTEILRAYPQKLKFKPTIKTVKVKEIVYTFSRKEKYFSRKIRFFLKIIA